MDLRLGERQLPITAWQDLADGEKMIAASRAFADAMRPFSTGASYLNCTHEARVVTGAGFAGLCPGSGITWDREGST